VSGGCVVWAIGWGCICTRAIRVCLLCSSVWALLALKHAALTIAKGECRPSSSRRCISAAWCVQGCWPSAGQCCVIICAWVAPA
jgi:hypothetical protein